MPSGIQSTPGLDNDMIWREGHSTLGPHVKQGWGKSHVLRVVWDPFLQETQQPYLWTVESSISLDEIKGRLCFLSAG